MPNTPVIVQKGVTIYALGNAISDGDHTVLKDMLKEVGVGLEMQEHYMDIMTALSGGGPSFVSVCFVSVWFVCICCVWSPHRCRKYLVIMSSCFWCCAYYHTFVTTKL